MCARRRRVENRSIAAGLRARVTSRHPTATDSNVTTWEITL
jgi:hypothetical protein